MEKETAHTNSDRLKLADAECLARRTDEYRDRKIDRDTRFSARKAALLSELDAKLKSEFAEEDMMLAALNAMRMDLYNAVEARKVREREAASALDPRIGVTYVEWGPPWHFSNSRNWRPTGRKAIAVVSTGNDGLHTTARLRAPERGTVYLRMLKASGKPGKNFEHMPIEDKSTLSASWSPTRWLPLGTPCLLKRPA